MGKKSGECRVTVTRLIGKNGVLTAWGLLAVPVAYPNISRNAPSSVSVSFSVPMEMRRALSRRGASK